MKFSQSVTTLSGRKLLINCAITMQIASGVYSRGIFKVEGGEGEGRGEVRIFLF